MKKLIKNPYNFWERIFSNPKDELGKSLKFKKNKIMKGNMYRTISKKDWEEALETGKFKLSLPLKQSEDYMENLKKTNPKDYKRIIYNENSRKFTRVTPKKDYALMNSTNDSDILVEFKPIYRKLYPSTEVGGYDELFAYDLSLGDILNVRDKKGNVIYKNSFNSLESRLISGALILSFLTGLFFLSPNLTGNVVGISNIKPNILGTTFILIGILGFFYIKSKK